MNGKYQPRQKVFLTGGNKNLIKEATVLKYTEVYVWPFQQWQRYQRKRVRDLPFRRRNGSSDPEQSPKDRDLSR